MLSLPKELLVSGSDCSEVFVGKFFACGRFLKVFDLACQPISKFHPEVFIKPYTEERAPLPEGEAVNSATCSCLSVHGVGADGNHTSFREPAREIAHNSIASSALLLSNCGTRQYGFCQD